MLQRKAEAHANSYGSPNLRAGIWEIMSFSISEIGTFSYWDRSSLFFLRRSVIKGPGSKLLIVTLCLAISRANAEIAPVKPARAPVDKHIVLLGDLTDTEVILTIRPNLRLTIPSITPRIKAIGASILRDNASNHCSVAMLMKSAIGGPPEFVINISRFEKF